MRVPQGSTKTRRAAQALETRLPGRGLLLARGIWITLVVLCLVILFASLPEQLARLHTPCTPTVCSTQQLVPEQAAVLRRVGWSLEGYAAVLVTLSLANVAFNVLLSTLIIWRRPDDRLALLVALMIVPPGVVIATNTVTTGSPSPWQVPHQSLNVFGLALVLLVFSLFPSGRFVPRWTRWSLVAGIGGLVLFIFFRTTPLLYRLGFLLFLSEAALLVGAQVYRYRRVSRPLERQQTKWVILAFTVSAAVYIGGQVLALLFPTLADRTSPAGAPYQLILNNIALLTAAVPLAFGVAVLRYRLWEIDLIINRTLVYGTLTASVVGCYILVVGYLGALFRSGGNLLISLVATGLVAVLFQPLRGWLQRGVNRLMYGQRDEPYAVVARLGRRLESTLAPEAVLSAIVETVAQALKLPYVAITLKQGEEFNTAAAYGSLVEGLLTLSLTYQAEPIGQLVLGPRQREESFSPTDRRLLEDLARQVSIAAHAVRLTRDLQRSRERLVTAREEERRRLRRDLHDGLGPTLGGLTLKVGAIRNLLPRDQAAADGLLVEMSAEIESAVGDIRRLAYDLRPPSLDELGLVGAIQARAARYRLPASIGVPADQGTGAAGRLHVEVEAPEHLPPLPAAVEVAAYRIVQEALANVARHAQARTCRVRLLVSEALEVEVRDDGVGLPTEGHTGVGLVSMRERAAELGGACRIESLPAGGVRVLARLPLTKE